MPAALKRLKPLQGLKQDFWQSRIVSRLRAKTAETLTGIETPSPHIEEEEAKCAKTAETLTGIETVHWHSAWGGW